MKITPTERLITVVAPHSCLLCNREGLPVCTECLAVFARPKKPVCFLCNSLSEDFKTCSSCSRKTPLKRVWVASRYEAYIKQLIKEFKFQHKRAAYIPLAEIIDQAVIARDYDLVCAVPCASTRYRRRGYNQSDLLARALAKKWQVQYGILLARHGQARQVGRSRAERLNQLANSFRATKSVEAKKILIIDDVTTTGATLDNCAKVLRSVGAKRVEAAVIAKV